MGRAAAQANDTVEQSVDKLWISPGYRVERSLTMRPGQRSKPMGSLWITLWTTGETAVEGVGK